MRLRTASMLVGVLSLGSLGAAETISFPAADGLMVTADLYRNHPASAPFILLFHQANYSRGEYLPIAPRLAALGFNAMAVDQRSGNGVRGVVNETAEAARAAGKGRSYLDALPDLEAAIAQVRNEGLATGPLILWGSSYSASLVLKLAGDRPDCCDAVLAFSPGEYFSPSDLILKSVRAVRVPVFITSARGEKFYWEALYAAIPAEGKTFFLPEERGEHGSSALWTETAGSASYWKAVEAFLAPFSQR